MHRARSRGGGRPQLSGHTWRRTRGAALPRGRCSRLLLPASVAPEIGPLLTEKSLDRTWERPRCGACETGLRSNCGGRWFTRDQEQNRARGILSYLEINQAKDDIMREI